MRKVLCTQDQAGARQRVKKGCGRSREMGKGLAEQKQGERKGRDSDYREFKKINSEDWGSVGGNKTSQYNRKLLFHCTLLLLCCDVLFPHIFPQSSLSSVREEPDTAGHFVKQGFLEETKSSGVLEYKQQCARCARQTGGVLPGWTGEFTRSTGRECSVV